MFFNEFYAVLMQAFSYTYALVLEKVFLPTLPYFSTGKFFIQCAHIHLINYRDLLSVHAVRNQLARMPPFI